jgi:hypothetical protein
MKLLNKIAYLAIMSGSLVGLASAGTNPVDYWIQNNGTKKVGYEKIGAGTPYAKEGTNWTGTLWGISGITAQTDPSGLRYDGFLKSGSTLYYFGGFYGNMQGGPDTPAFFRNNIVWLTDNQSVGTYNDTTYTVDDFDSKKRAQYQTNTRTARVKFEAIIPAGTYYHPELGYISSAYGDVYHIKYWPNVNNNNSLEEYWCLEGVGNIRTYGHANNAIAWFDPTATVSYTTPTPANPFYDPFVTPYNYGGGQYTTHVWNGAFEKDDGTGNHFTGWVSSSSDCTYTTTGTGGTQPPLNFAGGNEAGTWRARLKGASSGAANTHAAIKSYYLVPVRPGVMYTLSGQIWRESSSDNAYLDLDVGTGYASNGTTVVSFTNPGAFATTTNQWEYVSTTWTCPSGVYFVKVRCVHDNGCAMDAYYDDIRLCRTQ